MPLTFHHHQLPNGLDIVAEENPDSHSTALGLFVKTGSRDETPAINGVSHFLEHMMFKGSDRYTWEDVNRIFDEIGARYNAFTSQELTAYYANVLPEFTERAMEHLSHLLRPAIRQKDFDTEKKVILEEIAMYLDDPGHRLYERAMEEYYKGHPLAMSILGPAQTIRDLERDAMVDYFQSRYGPGNMVLSATGRIDFGQIVDLAEKYCGGWKRVNARRDGDAPAGRPGDFQMSDAKLNRQYTVGLTPGPSAQDERRFAARVLSDVIGDGEGSRFYWTLVDNAIAEDADFAFYPADGVGTFALSLVTDPTRSAEARVIALAELDRVRSDLNDAEVERAKNKIGSSIVLQGESPLGRMRNIGSQWIYNREYRSLGQDMATLMSITPDSLRALMNDFPFDPMTLVTLGPPEAGSDTAEPAPDPGQA